MNIKEYVLKRAQEAKDGARTLLKSTAEQRNTAIMNMSELIRNNAKWIMDENAKDVQNAKSSGLDSAMIDRLAITQKTLNEISNGLIEITKLPDPVGEILKMWKRPNGMTVGKMRMPIGVICMIYEARPNVTADAAGLCLKAGNAVILRGGSNAINSNMAIVKLLKEALNSTNLHSGIVSFIDIADRDAVIELLQLEDIIDVVIPRGGESLIRNVTKNSRIPVLKHYKGVCHVYVDNECDINMATNICFNAKVQRPGTCNAMETMLVHKDIAKPLFNLLAPEFIKAGVSVKACSETIKLYPNAQPLNDTDLYNEYLNLTINIKILDNIEQAIEHINKYSSSHTDAIVTNNYNKAMQFLNEVDSSAVMVNASTRLNDGGQFGLGAEIGISTDKIHARGPMGIQELTSIKFIVLGNGQLRQ
ncbi:Glutamate-5-semialdehyde dehydrogenase [Candidatus Magnetoovum chiemensis]|nr:Glutamate-5-semialdehyde dehydrogenase [Candidatus Magnetoovum chiemensis]